MGYFSKRNVRNGGGRFFRKNRSPFRKNNLIEKRKEYRRPDESFQMTESLEAAVWLEKDGNLDWSMAWIDQDGAIHKTYPVEMLLQVPEFVGNLASIFASVETLPSDVRTDLANLAAALDSLKSDSPVGIESGNGHELSVLKA